MASLTVCLSAANIFATERARSVKQEYLVHDLFIFQNKSKNEFPNMVKFGTFRISCHICNIMILDNAQGKGRKEGGREGKREGGREGEREGGREREREGGRERGREGEREGEREGGREGGRERGGGEGKKGRT